jgi:hypothetical protein
MLMFATEVPLASELGVGELLNRAKTWLAGSPHRNVKMDQLHSVQSGETADCEIDGSMVTIMHGTVAASSAELVGFRHSYVESATLHWTMEIPDTRSPFRRQGPTIEAARTLPARSGGSSSERGERDA